MYDMKEGGASVGRAEAGTVRCRVVYLAMVVLSSGRALIARHRGGTTLRRKSLSGVLLPAVCKRARTQSGLRDRRRHYLLERHTLEGDRPALPVMRGDY